jgi:hypothetical protein
MQKNTLSDTEIHETDPLKALLKSLKTFSREDLIIIRERTEALIQRREKAERKAALNEAKELLKKYNIRPEELMENKP